MSLIDAVQPPRSDAEADRALDSAMVYVALSCDLSTPSAFVFRCWNLDTVAWLCAANSASIRLISASAADTRSRHRLCSLIQGAFAASHVAMICRFLMSISSHFRRCSVSREAVSASQADVSR